MRVTREKSCGGITLKPCQACNVLKSRFYLCDKGHSTCFDCHELRRGNLRELAKRLESVRSPSPSIFDRISPSSAFTSTGRAASDFGALSDRKSPTRRLGSPPNFASRSSPESLSGVAGVENARADSVQTRGRVTPEVGEDRLKNFQVFCGACEAYTSVVPVTLPGDILRTVPGSSDQVTPEEDPVEDPEFFGGDEEAYDDIEYDADVPASILDPEERECLRREVDELNTQLVTAFSEMLNTRKDLDGVAPRTDKLGLDVDMLRGGVDYLYFNFDVLQSGKDVWTEERICGIPFVIMVRLRKLSGVPHLGFFIGLHPTEGLAHSPLKKIIVFRAHNAYGKIIETLNLETFKNGECVHLCFDREKRSAENSLWGYSNFLTKDRILKPDMLKDGRLCLSLQVKKLPANNLLF